MLYAHYAGIHVELRRKYLYSSTRNDELGHSILHGAYSLSFYFMDIHSDCNIIILWFTPFVD